MTTNGITITASGTDEASKQSERMRSMCEYIMSLYWPGETPLSRRETEVLRHLKTGKTRRAIAKELYIDLETVRSHINRIYHKLDVHYKEDAIRVATEKMYI